MKILLLEQDKNFAAQIQNELLTQDCLIDIATDWSFCWQLVELFEYDLILLDLLSLDPNAIKFCQRRRLLGDNIPILLIGIEKSSTDQESAKQVGATDYLTKPVAIETLLTKIQKLIRENPYAHPSIIQWQKIRLNFLDCQASYHNQPLYLNQTELALLALFVKNHDRIFSPNHILKNLWGFEENLTEYDLERHILQLRQKLQDSGASAGIIDMIHGLGYCLRSETQETFPDDLSFQPQTFVPKFNSTVSVRRSPHLENPAPRLLIIDHDLNLIQSLTTEAHSWGINAESVQNVTQARHIITLNPPDIVLLDIPLKETSEDELDLLSELSHANPPIPVLVSTEKEGFSERLKVAQMGGQGFLHKPISSDLVMEAVTHLLQQKAPPVGTLMIVGTDSAMLESFSNLLSP